MFERFLAARERVLAPSEEFLTALEILLTTFKPIEPLIDSIEPLFRHETAFAKKDNDDTSSILFGGRAMCVAR